MKTFYQVRHVAHRPLVLKQTKLYRYMNSLYMYLFISIAPQGTTDRWHSMLRHYIYTCVLFHTLAFFLLSCHNSLWSFLLTKLYILYRHPLNSINEQVDTRSYRETVVKQSQLLQKQYFTVLKKSNDYILLIMFLFSRLTFAISRKFTKDDKFQLEGVPLNPRTLRKVKMTQYVQRKVLSKQHVEFWLFAGRETRQQGSYTIYIQLRVALMFYCQAAILFQIKYTDERICLSLLIAIYFQNLM